MMIIKSLERESTREGKPSRSVQALHSIEKTKVRLRDLSKGSNSSSQER
jgi:hypothetical protein